MEHQYSVSAATGSCMAAVLERTGTAVPDDASCAMSVTDEVAANSPLDTKPTDSFVFEIDSFERQQLEESTASDVTQAIKVKPESSRVESDQNSPDLRKYLGRGHSAFRRMNRPMGPLRRPFDIKVKESMFFVVSRSEIDSHFDYRDTTLFLQSFLFWLQIHRTFFLYILISCAMCELLKQTLE